VAREEYQTSSEENSRVVVLKYPALFLEHVQYFVNRNFSPIQVAYVAIFTDENCLSDLGEFQKLS